MSQGLVNRMEISYKGEKNIGKCMIKKLLIGLVVFGAVCVLGVMWFANSAVDLPEDAETSIAQGILDTSVILEGGDTSYIYNDSVSIWYERIKSQDSVQGTVMLFADAGLSAMSWPQSFIKAFLDKGLDVIRFDYRGLGRSDWMNSWMPDSNEYSINDVAQDAILILDSLKTDSVHFVGWGFGAVVAQNIALKQKKRVQTLTSMMASGNLQDPDLPRIMEGLSGEYFKLALKYGFSSKLENSLKTQLGSQVLLKGEGAYKINSREIVDQVLYEIRKRKGFNPKAIGQHIKAYINEKDRYEMLKDLTVRSLVVHGTVDPVIPAEHGFKMAKSIPGSESLWVKGLGHSLPEEFIPEITGKILEHIQGISPEVVE